MYLNKDKWHLKTGSHIDCIFDSVNFLLPNIFTFIFGAFFYFLVFFFQKKPKGQEYYLGYFGQYKPTKGQGKINFEFATNLGNVNLTKNYGTLF